MSVSRCSDAVRHQTPLGRQSGSDFRRKALADRADARGHGAGAEAKRACPRGRSSMRVSQLWHWLYIRGVSDFDAHDQCRQGHARDAEDAFHHRPSGDRRGTDFQRRHPQMAAALSRRAAPAARSRSRPSTFRKRAAARSAFPARSAARSPVPSAIPARSSWCAT